MVLVVADGIPNGQFWYEPSSKTIWYQNNFSTTSFEIYKWKAGSFKKFILQLDYWQTEQGTFFNVTDGQTTDEPNLYQLRVNSDQKIKKYGEDVYIIAENETSNCFDDITKDCYTNDIKIEMPFCKPVVEYYGNDNYNCEIEDVWANTPNCSLVFEPQCNYVQADDYNLEVDFYVLPNPDGTSTII